MFIDFFRNDEGCSTIYKVDVPKILLKVQTKQELTGNNTWLLRIISQQVN